MYASGFNKASVYLISICRLGMMWPGVEPQRGQYNDTYLSMMKDLVDL